MRQLVIGKCFFGLRNFGRYDRQASRDDQSTLRGLITESAQAFVEDRTIKEILDAKRLFAQPGQLNHLEKYHGDKAAWCSARGSTRGWPRTSSPGTWTRICVAYNGPYSFFTATGAMKFPETVSPDERLKTGASPVDYDAELQLHNRAFRHACAILSHERVLDIGCGAGQTTRDAACAASAGSAVGIDVSAPMIARASELAAAQGVRNVRFEHGDAQAHPFPPQGFDVAISRFGTLFFADPIAAFRNIRGALADDGRLVMMVWQALEANEWSLAIQGDRAQSSAAFSLADPSAAKQILDAAGFVDATFQDVHEPVYYGDSAEAALDWIGQFQATRDALRSLDAASAEHEQARLRETVAQHHRDDGVWFDSRAWIISARCDN